MYCLTVYHTQLYTKNWDDYVREDEVGVRCDTHRRDGNAHRILVIKLGDLGINGRIILIKILKDEGVNMWTGFICLRLGTSLGLL